MRTNIRISLFLSVAVAFLCLYGCRLRHVSPSDPGYLRSAEKYYERIGEGEDVDWNEEIPVFHYWREIPSGDYYFDVPSDEQVGEWQELCEERNQTDSTFRFYVQGCYADMNQYVTVMDFVELWYHDDSRILDDDLTTWRLMQYDTLMNKVPDSEFDKYFSIKNTVQGLLLFEAGSQWELNFQAGLEADFQEYYDRLLVREAVRHSGGRLGEALEKEQEAWLSYHAAVDSAFRVIDGDPHGLVGSAWSMAIGGILSDNARMREVSLGDFYFALTDSLDYRFAHRRSMIGEYDIERHARVTEGDVLAVIKALTEEMRRQMQMGKTIVLDDFGRFHLSVKSDMVDRKADYNIKKHVKKVVCRFTPTGHRDQLDRHLVRPFCDGTEVERAKE